MVMQLVKTLNLNGAIPSTGIATTPGSCTPKFDKIYTYTLPTIFTEAWIAKQGLTTYEQVKNDANGIKTDDLFVLHINNIPAVSLNLSNTNCGYPVTATNPPQAINLSSKLLTLKGKSTTFRVRLLNSGGGFFHSTSSAIYFFNNVVVAPIKMTSPNGGETWNTGTQHQITWNKTAESGTYVRIDLFKAGGWLRGISGRSANTGSINWVVFSGLQTGNDYQIQVKSLTTNHADISDQTFKIINTDVVIGKRYKCVNNQCVETTDTGTGTYATLAECQSSCQPPALKWECVNGTCVQTATGTYDTKAACQANCTIPTTKYKCVNNQCVTTTDTGIGTYDTLAACQAACQPPPLKWECVNGICLQTATGTYDTKSKCEAACKGPMPFGQIALILVAILVIYNILLKKKKS